MKKLVYAAAIAIVLTTGFGLRHFMVNTDEFEYLVTGYLMSVGKRPYIDFFTHHWPMPYVWSAAMAPFFTQGSPHQELAVFRSGILMLYAGIAVTLFLINKRDRTRQAMTLWLMVLPASMAIYHGQMALTDTFLAILISWLFWLTVPVTLGWEESSAGRDVTAVAVAAAMVWTHPGSVAVAIIPALISGKKIRTIVITGAALVIPLAVLAAGGMLMPFWKQALVFNQEVYAKFYPERRNNLTMSQQTWSDFWRNEAKLFTNLSWPVGVSQWLWHAGFWGLGIYAISKKNHRLVGIWLALFLTIHSREVKFFPGQMFNYALYPAVLTGTAALAIGRPVVKVALVIVIIASGVAAWPIFIQSAKPGYNYQVFWSDRVKLGEKVAKLTAKDETILAYYPVFDVFFFSRRLPADLFWYWHPWIAAGEGNSQDRQQTIERRIPAAIIPGQEKPSQAMVDNYEPVKDEPQIWIRK